MENEYDQIRSNNDEWTTIDPAGINGSSRKLTAQQARLWSLVLDSRYIPCQLKQFSGEWCLLTPPCRLAEAFTELRNFERENSGWPPPSLPPRPLFENILATLSALLLLATFHNITHLQISSRIDWLASGSAHAERILDGEWWRLITALTLHSDVVHLLSNLSIGGIFVLLLCRELGAGLAWSLLLAAGVSGNYLNALMQPGTHVSIGASTAVFGSVGILASLRLERYHHHRQRRWALPIASALALLAILGTEGKQTDLGAHLFGFLCGTMLGLITAGFIEKFGQPKPLLNILLAILCGVTVVAAWLVALGAG